MTIIFKVVLSRAKQVLLLGNNIFYDCAQKICIINMGLIFNNIRYVFKYFENIRYS